MFQSQHYKKVQSLLEEHQILFVVGPRRAGKTTLVKKLVADQPEQRLYVSADQLLSKNFQSAQELITYLEFEGLLKPAHKQIFIDEAHFLPHLGIILKNFFDQKQYQVIVTGSGSLKIFTDIGSELVGRKYVYYLYPFSFSDFLLTKGKKLPLLADYNLSLQKSLFTEWQEYLEWGGYPEVVLAKTKSQKLAKQQLIFDSYLQEDIRLILEKEDFFQLEKILELLAKSVASLFKYESLQKRLGMSKKSLVKVREVLDHTFLTYHLPPLPQTYKDTIRKHHKTYFIDVGLLRFLQKKSLQGYLGQIAENLVLTELIKVKPDHFKLYFWQRINATEVDFVLHNLLTEKLIPVEVKTRDTDNIPKAFSTFEQRFGSQVDYYIVINNSIKKVRQFQDKKVYFVPAFYAGQIYKVFSSSSSIFSNGTRVILP